MVAKFGLTEGGQMNIPEIQTQVHVYKQTDPKAIPTDVQQ